MFRKPLMAGLGLLELVREATSPAPKTVEQLTRDQVRSIVLQEAGHFLEDFEWRYKQARDLYKEMQQLGLPVAEGGYGDNVIPFRRQLTAEDLNTTRHVLTGYTVTPNSSTSPTVTAAAGNFAWAGLHIVYKGVDYTITDGAAGLTNKYFTFQLSAMGTVTNNAATGALTGSVAKPTLGADDILVFQNPTGANAGTPIVAASDAHGSMPGILANNAVDTAALQSGAVLSGNLGPNSVIAGKLADGAVDTAARLGNNVVTNAAVAAGALLPGRLNIASHILF